MLTEMRGLETGLPHDFGDGDLVGAGEKLENADPHWVREAFEHVGLHLVERLDLGPGGVLIG